MMRLFVLSLAFLSACALITGNRPADNEPAPVSSAMSVRVDTVLTGLKVPWGMAFLPSGDMLFTERGGELRLFQNGELHPDPIAGIPTVKAKGQGGLLDIELHPDYENNGWIYLSYSSFSADGGEGGESEATTAFVRGRIQDHKWVDQELIFKGNLNYSPSHHYGGRIEFDPDGYLYLSIGDRGGRDEAQLLDVYRGKIFRLHDDGRVPDDNPFISEKGAHPEIFTYGHRNPQGMTLNPFTGEIWEHEHGPKGGDEVNIIRKGTNYGWPTITYGINYNGTIITEDTAKKGMEQPITYWVPSIAPCGMDFVEDEMYGDWKGDLLVGSLKFRYLVRCEVDGNEITGQEILLENIGRVRAIRQAPDGYIYVAIEGPGMIIRLIPA